MIPNEVIIDLEAIRDNFFAVKTLAGHDTRILAVVKADAYGHGVIPVAATLESAGADYLGVFDLEEALHLRQAGCRLPILVMMGIRAEEVPAVLENGLTPALFQQEIAEALSRASVQHHKVTPVHVKVDTGMTRLGVPSPAARSFLQSLTSMKGIRVEGMFSHLATSDQPENPFTEQQIGLFSKILNMARDLGICPEIVHIANSGALLDKKGFSLGMVRPGILLYGSPPSPGRAPDIPLKPAMCFKSRVIQVQSVPAGTPISYGCTYRTPARCTIAAIPVGYDDGYSRMLSNKGEVLIRGKRVPVVGRVTMNLTMLNVSSVEGVAVGDEVVLLGSQGRERITAEEIAEKIGTISYEVLCNFGKSNRRTYVHPR